MRISKTICLSVLSLLTLFYSSKMQSQDFKHLTTQDGLSDLLVNCIFKDSQGFMWLGSSAGINKYDGTKFKTYYFPNTKPNNKTFAFAETDTDGIWIGNINGLWYLDHKSEQMIRIHENIIHSTVNDLYTFDKYKLLIASNLGLYLKDKKNFRNIRHILPVKDENSPFNKIHGICRDNKGIFWLSTFNGIYSYDTTIDKFSFYSLPNIHTSHVNLTKLICIDSTLYIASMENGLFRFNITDLCFNSENLPGLKSINDLKKDDNNTIVIATDGDGIHYFSHTRQRIEKTLKQEPNNPKGIKSNHVQSLYIEPNYMIWIGFSTDGCEYKLSENYEKKSAYALTSESKSDITDREIFFIDCFNKEGIPIYTKSGIYKICHNIFNYKIDEESKVRLYITDMYVNGYSMSKKQQNQFYSNELISLNGDENSIAFKFVNLLYANNSALIYEYKLEGYDNKWLRLDRYKNIVNYTNLKPGDYTFKLRLPDVPYTEVSKTISIGHIFSASFYSMVFLSILLGCFLLLFIFTIMNNRKNPVVKILVADAEDQYSDYHDDINEERTLEETAYKNINIDENECKRLKLLLESLINDEKIYCNPDLNRTILCEKMGIPSHNLSYFFSQYLKCSYPDYINSYRVEHFKKLATSDINKNFTVETMAEMSGFNSQSSFFRIFKKTTGCSPSEFISEGKKGL